MTHLEALQTVPHFSHTLVTDSSGDAASLDEHSLPSTSSDELPLVAPTIGGMNVGASRVVLPTLLAFHSRGHRSGPLCVHPVLFKPETMRGRRMAGVVGIAVTIGASVAKLYGISESVFCRRSKPRAERCEQARKITA